MLLISIRKFRAMSTNKMKACLPICITTDGVKSFVVTAYIDNQPISRPPRSKLPAQIDNQARKPVHTAMDEIMALPEFNPAIHKKGDHVRVYDQLRDSWSRLIVP